MKINFVALHLLSSSAAAAAVFAFVPITTSRIHLALTSPLSISTSEANSPAVESNIVAAVDYGMIPSPQWSKSNSDNTAGTSTPAAESNIVAAIDHGIIPSPQRSKSNSDNTAVTSTILPGQYENEKKFIYDDSAQFWRDYNSNGEYKTEDFVAVATDVSKRFFSKGDDAWSYWLRHTARSGYFVSTAALGFVASRLHDQLLSKQESIYGRRGGLARKLASDVPHLMAEAALTYEKDYQCILEGKYKLPYDMYTRNRQNNPLYFGEKTARFIRDAVGTISRRDQGLEKDKRIWLNADTDGIYPDYYKHAFHYQKDGWMSQNSADIYETSTESLFLGRQDAMQRTALVPLLEYVNGNSDNVKKSSGDKKPLKVLEVGCGTGRFLTFVRDNLPLDAECTAVDLSPFYLNNARDNDKNWMSVRGRVEASHGNASVKIAPASFVQAKGEDLPFDDEVFDVVLCMYVYHEVPRDIRGQIASEMARVTKKGGRVILTDSIQKGDRPCLDSSLGRFGSMNEPYYEDYIEDYLPNHFESAGLECSTKTVRSNSKSLAFKKPEKLEPLLAAMTDMFFNEANLA